MKVIPIKYGVFVMLLISHAANGQIIELNNEKLLALPRAYGSKNFVELVEQECKQLVHKKVDSILVYYTTVFPENFAVIVWKKKRLSSCTAFYQSDYTYYPVSKKPVTNDTLLAVNIDSIYKVFNNDAVRTKDTNVFVAHDHAVYCQFYFDHKTEVKAAYWFLTGRVDHAFQEAYENERDRLFFRLK